MPTSPDSRLDILFILAHPDDESFGNAGILSWAAANGIRVGLVCATRGEVGEISDPSLGTPETLGAVRERELRTAMATAGVDALRLLPYRDSGMAGTPPNDDPRSLVQASREAVLADVVFHIRDLQPQIVVTFGPDGVYGHPDHIRIGEIATEAVTVAASDELAYLGASWKTHQLFHVAIAREDLLEANLTVGGLFSNTPREVVATWGIPRAEITHIFDVSAFVPQKLEVMRCHATQLPFNADSGGDEIPGMRPWLSRESMVKKQLPWTNHTDEFSVLDTFNSLELKS